MQTMITPELIARINELARKKRAQGLTVKEKKEQAVLRRIYLDGIRAQMVEMLDSIEIVDEPAADAGTSNPDSSPRSKMGTPGAIDIDLTAMPAFQDKEHIH